MICELAEPVDWLPVTPLLYGCELEKYRKVGTEVIIAGFGRTSNTGSDYGTMHWAKQKISAAEADRTIIGTAGTPPSPCNGDSGGPVYLQVDDGSWRNFGTVWKGISGVQCNSGFDVQRPDQVVPYFETETGIDITPCFDGQTGDWDPSEDCRGFFAGSEKGVGTWDDRCDGTPTSDYSDQCGNPWDFDDSTSEVGATGDTGESSSTTDTGETTSTAETTDTGSTTSTDESTSSTSGDEGDSTADPTTGASDETDSASSTETDITTSSGSGESESTSSTSVDSSSETLSSGDSVGTSGGSEGTETSNASDTFDPTGTTSGTGQSTSATSSSAESSTGWLATATEGSWETEDPGMGEGGTELATSTGDAIEDGPNYIFGCRLSGTSAAQRRPLLAWIAGFAPIRHHTAGRAR